MICGHGNIQGPGNFQGPELLAAPGKFQDPGYFQAPWKIPGGSLSPVRHAVPACHIKPHYKYNHLTFFLDSMLFET